MKRLLKVESSNPTKLGHFCNKLVCKVSTTVPSPFGAVTSETQETYYMFTGNQNKLGFEAELDITLFDVVMKPHSIIKEDGLAETIQLKYLYPKK